MKLIIASNNKGKVSEIKQILSPYFTEILSLHEAGLNIEVIEDGDTFEANAIKKSEEVLGLSDADAVLSDDSGLMVDALGGAPGVYSARYSGEGASDMQNNEKLLKELMDIPEQDRTAKFVSCVALSRRSRPTITALGTCEGIILQAGKGENGFGYDPLFFSPEIGVTFGEADDKLKNRISHRFRALTALREKLEGEE